MSSGYETSNYMTYQPLSSLNTSKISDHSVLNESIDLKANIPNVMVVNPSGGMDKWAGQVPNRPSNRRRKSELPNGFSKHVSRIKPGRL